MSEDRLIKPSQEDRLAVYLGNHEKTPIILDERSTETIVLPNMNFDTFWRVMQCSAEGKRLLQNWSVLKLHNQFSGHVLPVVQLCNSLGIEQPCLVKIFDNRTDFDRPVFCKSVDITKQKSGRYILPLDYKRHWAEVFSLPDYPKAFSEKKCQVVWRGATTGNWGSGRDDGSRSRMFVASGVEAFKKHGHDIGFSKRIQTAVTSKAGLAEEQLNLATVGGLSIDEQLDFKYLLSLEGNDVASGLKWMLRSNSLVLMPPPTCETWACESLLKPFVHFIPVAYDLSDLQEKFEWCEQNQSICEEIILNANQFMSVFEDREAEFELAQMVVRKYFEDSDFSVHGDFLSRIEKAKAADKRDVVWPG